MFNMYPHLLSPLQMGNHELKNRVVMAPLTRGRAGAPLSANDLMGDYYSQRASAGLIISEGAHISIMGRGWFHAPDVFEPSHGKAWKLVTDKVHESNGVIFCQLWHCGRASHSSFRHGITGYEGKKAISVAPSPIKRPSVSGKQYHTQQAMEVDIEEPREMSKEEIEDLPEEFRKAAQTAMDGGFDGVEVHSASGFLLDTFLQSCSNKRDDQYGGSHENRFRVIDKILRAVFTVYDPKCVGIRLSPNGAYNDMGSDDFREAFLYYASRLSEYGLGYLHIVIGLDFGFHNKGDPMTLAEFRKVYPGIIMANMGYNAESAEKEIADGNADLVSFGRAFLSNPDLVEKFAAGTELEPMLDPKYWYTSVDHVWTTEGYTDLDSI